MIQIGIVGAGIIGKEHSDAILKNNDCVLAAVADIDEAKAKEIAQEHNAPYFTDYKKMAEYAKMDAVILNLPHYLHCEVCTYFLNKGINVLVEKPMAMNVEECDKMIAAAKKSGSKLAVGHVQRYFSALREIKKIIESKKFGKLCMIREVRNVNYLPNRPGWFLKKELSGGGIVMNYGAHTLDRIFYTTGLSVKKVYATVSNPLSEDNVEINAQLLLELGEDVSASVTYCGCHIPGEHKTEYYFTNGVAKVEGGGNLLVFENGQFVNYGGTAELISEQLKEFVRFLNGEESEIVLPEYGREIISVIEKIYE
ncbi:MAG: Gfo/Idh/MocA family oxidoreductase [Clostridia bacterium]|nr:Gfo/Idh/MocA family oxidoreductase [Clostridia bacterium]